MDDNRFYNCEAIVLEGNAFFRWYLTVVADKFSVVAKIAEEHVARVRPSATIWDMKLKAGRGASDCGAGIFCVFGPLEIPADEAPFLDPPIFGLPS